MRVPFPLCRSSSSDHRGFLDIRKDRTVGGIRRKCQPPSQQIVHEKTQAEVEGWLSLESELSVCVGAIQGVGAVAAPAPVLSVTGADGAGAGGGGWGPPGPGGPRGGPAGVPLGGPAGTSSSAGGPPGPGPPGGRTQR